MPEQALSPDVDYERNVKRILSDTALIYAGAIFEDDTLVVPPAQIAEIAEEDPRAVQIVPEYLRADRLLDLPYRELMSGILTRLQDARGMLRTAYRAQRLEQTIQQMDPSRPTDYVQTIRYYIRQSDLDQTQSSQYDISDTGATELVKSDEELIRHDIARILPHRDGLRLYYDHWFDVVDGVWLFPWQSSEAPAEDGFINHALALYGMTARMALHARKWGLGSAVTLYSMQELPEPQRLAILQTTFDEWREFTELVSDPAILSEMRHSRPLLFRTVEELRTAIAEYPQFEPERIAKHFISHPRAFHNILARLAARAQLRADRLARGPKLTTRELEARAQAQRALSTKNPHQFSEQLAPGEILRFEDPATIDDVVFATLARLDANATQLYGEPTGNVWKSPTIKNSALERLRPKLFIGKFEKPCVVILPIDDVYIDKYATQISNKDQIDRESMIRLNVIADMRYSGKGVRGQSILDVVLYTRDIADPEARSHVLSIRGQSSGEKVADYVNALSSENAMHILGVAMRHPLRGGRVSPR